MIQAGLSISEVIPVGRKAPGTIASFNPSQFPPLSPQALEHLHTRAAIPYRDPTLSDSIAKICTRRELEQDNCGLKPLHNGKNDGGNLVTY